MTDFAGRLVARALGTMPVVEPRAPLRFGSRESSFAAIDAASPIAFPASRSPFEDADTPARLSPTTTPPSRRHETAAEAAPRTATPARQNEAVAEAAPRTVAPARRELESEARSNPAPSGSLPTRGPVADPQPGAPTPFRPTIPESPRPEMGAQHRDGSSVRAEPATAPDGPMRRPPAVTADAAPRGPEQAWREDDAQERHVATRRPVVENPSPPPEPRALALAEVVMAAVDADGHNAGHDAGAPPQSPAEAAPIIVEIGSIEFRSVSPPAAPSPPPVRATAALSLDAYLSRRRGER